MESEAQTTPRRLGRRGVVFYCPGASAKRGAAPNAETIIGYYVARPAEVERHIYDIAGQRVRQLREGVRGAGSYRTCWDGRDDDGRSVSPGVDIYRITANRRSAKSGGAAAAAQDAAAQIRDSDGDQPLAHRAE